MKDMILFPEDVDRMNAVLGLLVSKANLLLATLINKDGRLLTSQGSLESVDTTSLAALIAGNSASTLAIAQLVGESEFSTMYHQGKDKHIYIATVDDNTFLSLVFDDRTNIDRVKVFARQFDRQIKEVVGQVYNKTEDQVDLDLGGNFDFSQQSTLQDSPTYPSPEPGVQLETGLPGGQSNATQSLQPDASPGLIRQVPNDTNNLFLQNKIRESVKRAKHEE